MGASIMLPLHGVATSCAGVKSNERTTAIRLRNVEQFKDRTAADFAIIRNEADLRAAADVKFDQLFVVGDEINITPSAAHASKLIAVPAQFAYLANGDVIGLNPESRRFRTLYRRESDHNSFLVTDQCNHYCLMCSQPPKKVDDSWILAEIESALPLIDVGTKSLGFTGGEPLLGWKKFIRVLKNCRQRLPSTSLHVLSNGRAFARNEVVDEWASVEHEDLMVGIPIYSAVDHVHDYVVQSTNAFDETVLGILKLKDRRQRVEVRVVLHSITAPRIVETCAWFARNLPFVDHVALMGLENTGFAIANDKLLWIDPLDYRNELAEAVAILAAADMRVSVYNLQRCVLDQSVWPYAIRSISDWKNGYAKVCDQCDERPNCAGFFTTGRPKLSRGIAPIRLAPN